MTIEYTTLRVPKDEAQKARKAKRDGETWGEYLMRCAEVEPVGEFTEDEIRAIVRNEIASYVHH